MPDERTHSTEVEREDHLPTFPWNDLIGMTGEGYDVGRPLIIALAAIHDAINENTRAVRALLVSGESEGR